MQNVPASSFVLRWVADIKGISPQHMTSRYVVPCSFNQSAQSKRTCSQATRRSLNSLTHPYTTADIHSHMQMQTVLLLNSLCRAAHESKTAPPVLNKLNFSRGTFRQRLILLQNTPQSWCLYHTQTRTHMWTGEQINVPNTISDTGLWAAGKKTLLFLQMFLIKQRVNHASAHHTMPRKENLLLWAVSHLHSHV